MAIGYVHSTESFGAVDGPGIRFVFFLSGCRFRCKYCHNPDTWSFNSGEVFSPQDAVATALKYKNYIKNGGVTFSGGEPLEQIDFIIETSRLLKENGIHVAVDTTGFTFNKNDQISLAKHTELIKYVDLFLLDIKHIDDDAHVKITGQSNKNTLDFLSFINANGKKSWIRYVVCPTLSDDLASAKKLKDYINGFKFIDKVEVIPYHTLGKYKYQKLNIPYSLEGVLPPDEATIKAIKDILLI